ncbi:serine/threonine-protein phosphatase PGAM5, mitochondrial-like [Paramormyrops kingsleyae]|uniref:Serine/threonine-protein phosphatase PGAM5, mitochondrial n=1 Tax=Paramormyrops kingsleyae TaxID=1676925 RepID=A0A3B3QNP3_9TELE|nr:serine/threonine-protein phosphatase PGAM5, mitochondrial-like [Paramormyrops kingsleyae]
MASRRALKMIFGVAGGSAALAVTAAGLRGHLGNVGEDQRRNNWNIFTPLGAAQPHPLSLENQNLTVTPSGNDWDINWDKRDPVAVLNSKMKREKAVSSTEDQTTELQNNKPRATRHIILIRHSQYNQKGSDDKERFLTSLGREQAELTAQRLATLGLKYDILIHSTMTRATETADIIGKHLPEVKKMSCDLLREGSPVEPVPRIGQWRPESVYHEDGARIEAAFRRYIHRADVTQKQDSYEIIVCHANVIRYFVCRALQFPPEGWLRMGLNNGSITWLTIRPSGRVGLRMLGDSGFMPPEKLTRS